MNRNETMALLGALKVLDMRGFVTIDDPTIDVWHVVMNREPGISGRDAMRTAYELVSKPDATFPTPGQFRAMVAETVDGVPTLAEARAQLQKALNVNYPGQPPTYSPAPIVKEAIQRMGGTYRFRTSESKRETDNLWRSFDEAYRAVRDEHVSPHVELTAIGDAMPAIEKGRAS